MEEEGKPIKEMNVEEVKEFIDKEFGAEVADHFSGKL